ncbi:MAG: hypothetical protein KA313_10130 [Pseudarcicella sp.]|nr:hypothetical protein [Pseudarcicella sp.]
MKISLYILTFFIFISCTINSDKKKDNVLNKKTNTFKKQSSLTNDESEYLKTRNSYCGYFKNVTENSQDLTEIYKQDSDSLLVLEKMLREILKNSRINSISKFGKINLETLTPEDLGGGMLDGLNMSNKSQNIFVTSKALFLDYFKSQEINSLDNLTSSQLSNIFSALISDARTTVFYSEKIASNNNKIVYSSIGITAQDIGCFPPNFTCVLIESEGFIYIIQKYNDNSIKTLSKCQTIHDSIYSQSQKYFDEYNASNLKDETLIDKKIKIEEIAWDKYCKCYQENFKNDKQYNTTKKEIDKMIKFIE